MTRSISILSWLLLPTLVSATAGPVLGDLCPSWMESWGLCDRNYGKYWALTSCGDGTDSETDEQLLALSEFYTQTGNTREAGPLFDQGWLSDCYFCDWEGITCSEDGDVTAIESPDNDPPLQGRFPTAVLELPYLETLILSGNELRGEIPAELGTLYNLTTLKLHYNDFEGKMPDEVCELGNHNGGGVYISADCAKPGIEVKCERTFCCDGCYSDAFRGREAELDELEQQGDFR